MLVIQIVVDSRVSPSVLYLMSFIADVYSKGRLRVAADDSLAMRDTISWLVGWRRGRGLGTDIERRDL